MPVAALGATVAVRVKDEPAVGVVVEVAREVVVARAVTVSVTVPEVLVA